MARANESEGVGVAARGKTPRRSAREWAEEVAAWRRSGFTAKDYASRRKISAATLLWWSSRGRVRSAEARHGEAVAGVRRPADTRVGGGLGAFLPVRVTERPENESRLEVEIVVSGDRRVRVLGGLALPELTRLVDALERGASC